MTLRHHGAAAALACVLVAGTSAVGPAHAVTTPPPLPVTTAPATTPGGDTPPPTPAPTSTVGGPGLLRPGVLHSLPAGVPKPPELKANAYVVADLRDGRIILAKNAHVQSRPASTLKTLTALTLAPKLPPRQIVTATAEDANIEGTKVGLVAGEGYTVRELLMGLLLSSGNDAANALARANGGMPATAHEMTERAHRIGALDTFAKNSSGLDATGQLTSAYDLALLGKVAVDDPLVSPYLTVKTAEIAGKRTAGKGSRRERYQISSHNRLLWNYDGMIGVKNGFTKAAGQTYIGAAKRGDQSFVITYLGGTSVGWRDTAAVLDWAFANGPKARPVGELVDPATFDENKTPPVEPVEPAATGGPESTAAASALGLSPAGGRGLLALLGGGAALLAGAAVTIRHRMRRRRP